VIGLASLCQLVELEGVVGEEEEEPAAAAGGAALALPVMSPRLWRARGPWKKWCTSTPVRRHALNTMKEAHTPGSVLFGGLGLEV